MRDLDLPFVPGLFPDGEPVERIAFVFRRRKLVLVDGGVVRGRADALGVTLREPHFLGTVGGAHVVAAELDDDAALPESATEHDLITLYGRLSEPMHALAGRAAQIVEWARTHRFCGACSTPTVASPSARSRLCPACGLEAFPRLSPAIIVAVEREGEILLARSPHFPRGIYSVLAGFVDPGESVEQAIAREVEEEVGLAVRNVRYFGSQPWPHPNSLMLGFQADYVSGDIAMQPGEIEDAGFFTAKTMPKVFPGKFSIAQWLIADFLARHPA